MQEPSRQLLRHFTGRLAQAELLELRPEFAIANSHRPSHLLGTELRGQASRWKAYMHAIASSVMRTLPDLRAENEVPVFRPFLVGF